MAESSLRGLESGTRPGVGVSRLQLLQLVQKLFGDGHFKLQQKALMKYLTPVLGLPAAQKVDSQAARAVNRI